VCLSVGDGLYIAVKFNITSVEKDRAFGLPISDIVPFVNSCTCSQYIPSYAAVRFNKLMSKGVEPPGFTRDVLVVASRAYS